MQYVIGALLTMGFFVLPLICLAGGFYLGRYKFPQQKKEQAPELTDQEKDKLNKVANYYQTTMLYDINQATKRKGGG